MDFTEFSNKAKDGFNLIPLIKELDSIKKEAIDIYGDHFDQKKSFFFESLEGDKNWSRYTIIGCSSGDYLEVFGNKIKKYSNFLEESEYHDDNPINWIENFFSSYKVFIPKTLPSFCGGLVGHFSFESVCYFEESVIRRDQKNDINAPDISLIICKEFIVFDKVNNKIFIVVFSNNTSEGYKESTKKLKDYEFPEKKCYMYFTKEEESYIKGIASKLPKDFILIEPHAKTSWFKQKQYPLKKLSLIHI